MSTDDPDRLRTSEALQVCTECKESFGPMAAKLWDSLPYCSNTCREKAVRATSERRLDREACARRKAAPLVEQRTNEANPNRPYRCEAPGCSAVYVICGPQGFFCTNHAPSTYPSLRSKEATSWPPYDVVRKLADAVNHLLLDHDCDAHGHEEIARARDEARAWLGDAILLRQARPCPLRAPQGESK